MLTTLSAVRFAASACLSALLQRRALNCLWEVTYRCNARCGFCGYWRRPSAAAGELSADQIAQGLTRVRAAGCRLVNFTGGEPLLRPDLPRIVNAAAHLELWTSVVTNGSTLSLEKVRELRSAGLCNLLVSLDSTVAEDHDIHRGIPKLFEKVERCMEWLRSDFLSGYRTGGVMWVVREGNLDQLEAAVDSADSRGVFIVIQALHLQKTGSGNGSGLGPAAASGGALVRLRKRHRCVLNSGEYLSAMGSFMAGSGPASTCQAGRKYFSVDPYGSLHPCVDLPARGHVLKDSIDVLRSPQALDDVKRCPGCWYCFRGEADCSLGARGCLSKLAVASRVLYRNAISAREPRSAALA